MSAQQGHLFLVSTPLHLLVSLAIIAKEKPNNCQLWFIDQDPKANSLYREQLQSWSEQPFNNIEVFYRPVKNLGKLKHRKAMFAGIDRCLKNFTPSDIYVGNDRRIEFQYAMHKVSQLANVQGHYMDEGTFTYVGRSASNSVSDKIIDNALKKLFYGRWWQHPETVGASAWVNHIYVSLPEDVHPLLKNKATTKLDSNYWQADLLLAFCQRLLSAVVDCEQLASIDMLLTLPHESILTSESFQKDLVLKAVQQAIAKGQVVAAKYHPRDLQQDVLELKEKGAIILPAAVPFEAMLPLLKPKVQIVGDFSTTLITGKLLKPEADIFALKQTSDRMAQFVALYQALGIEFLTLEK